MKTLAKYLATGLLTFFAVLFFVFGVYLTCLYFKFDEETHIPVFWIAVAEFFLFGLALTASIYLCKRWSISFWHQCSIRSVLALVLALAIGLTLVSRPAKIQSRELEQNDQIVKYEISMPGLGSMSSNWTIRKDNNLPTEEIDELAKREVELYYYCRGDDNVAAESWMFAALSFSFFYLALIPWRSRSNQKEE